MARRGAAAAGRRSCRSRRGRRRSSTSRFSFSLDPPARGPEAGPPEPAGADFSVTPRASCLLRSDCKAARPRAGAAGDAPDGRRAARARGDRRVEAAVGARRSAAHRPPAPEGTAPRGRGGTDLQRARRRVRGSFGATCCRPTPRQRARGPSRARAPWCPRTTGMRRRPRRGAEPRASGDAGRPGAPRTQRVVEVYSAGDVMSTETRYV